MKPSEYLGSAFGALAIGSAIAFLPRVTTNFSESGIEGSIKVGISFLQLPGVVVGLFVFRNVHGISLWVVDATDVIFYTGLLYFLFAAWAKHKAKR